MASIRASRTCFSNADACCDLGIRLDYGTPKIVLGRRQRSRYVGMPTLPETLDVGLKWTTIVLARWYPGKFAALAPHRTPRAPQP